MAQELEKLIVKIEADIKDYKAKLGQSSKETEKATKKMNSSFDKLKGIHPSVDGLISKFATLAGPAAIAGAAAALGFFAVKAIDTAGTIEDTSKKLGVSTDFFQEMSYAATLAGVSQQNLEIGLRSLNRRMGEAVGGNEGFKRSFDALGVALTDSQGRVRATEDVFFDMADAISKVGSSSEQAAFLAQTFGISGAELVNLFKDGSPALRKFQQEAQAIGLVIDKDLIKGAGAAGDQLDILKTVISAQLTQALLMLAPAIQTVVTGFVGLIRETKAAAQAFGAWVSSFSGGAAEIEKFAAKQRELDNQVGAGKITGAERNALLAQYRTSLEKTTASTAAATEANANQAASEQNLMTAMKAREELQKNAQKLVDTSAQGSGAEKIEAELGLLRSAAAQKIELDGSVSDAIKAKEFELDTLKTEMRQKEIEALIERNALLRETNDIAYADEIAANQMKVDQLMAQEDAHSTFSLKTRKKQKEGIEKIEKEQFEFQKALISDSATLADAATRGRFNISKKAAIAEAVMQGGLAVQKAFANPPGPPFSIPQTIAAGVKAAANVASIAGVGLAKGIEEVPGIGRGDKFPAMLESGEGVITRTNNKKFDRLFELLEQGGGLGGPVRIELSLRDELVELVEARIIERGRLGISLERAA